MLPGPLGSPQEEGLVQVESLLELFVQEAVEVVVDQLVGLVKLGQGLDWTTAKTWGRNQRRRTKLQAP